MGTSKIYISILSATAIDLAHMLLRFRFVVFVCIFTKTRLNIVQSNDARKPNQTANNPKEP